VIEYNGSNNIYSKIKENNIKNKVNSANVVKAINKYNCSKQNIIFVKSEESLIHEFTKYIYSFKNLREAKHQYLKNTRLIHWSSAETVIFNKKLIEYNITGLEYKLPWFDLLAVFKNSDHPIIIKECFSFSLKNVVKTLTMHKLIDLSWSDLDDGLLSSFIAKQIYSNTNVDITSNNKEMEEIIEYNYIDCIAIYMLLTFIRKY
jgi:hypothetical protein